MKRAFLLGIAILLAAGITLAAGTKHQKSVTVKINNEAAVPDTNLRIAFTELVEDARCPEDTTCVWAGNAKIKVRISENGRSEVLELNTNPRSTETVKFGGYTLKLVKLTPVPRTNIRINRNGYEATIEVSKAEKPHAGKSGKTKRR